MLVRKLSNSISQSETSKQEEREKKAGKEREAGGAQYRPIMESLDRPAPRGRQWEFLIGGKRKWAWPISVQVIGQKRTKKETTADQEEGQTQSDPTGGAFPTPSGPELHTRRRSVKQNCALAHDRCRDSSTLDFL